MTKQAGNRFPDQVFEIKIYPRFLKRLFVCAFTEGLKEPNKRVRENEQISHWQLQFSYYCSYCGIECFMILSRKSDSKLAGAITKYPPMWLYIDEQPILSITIQIRPMMLEKFNFTKIVGQSHNIQRTNENGVYKPFHKDWLFFGDSIERRRWTYITPRSKTTIWK